MDNEKLAANVAENLGITTNTDWLPDSKNNATLLANTLRDDKNFRWSFVKNMALHFSNSYFSRSCMSPNHSKPWMLETAEIAANDFIDNFIKTFAK